MLDVISVADFKKHLEDTHQAISTVQWQDQYELQINMVKPAQKKVIPTPLIKNFSLKLLGLEIESSPIGTSQIRRYSNGSSNNLDITFYNPIEIDKKIILDEDNIQDYFFTNKNKNIIPGDGTFLLPTEFYFYIKCFALNAKWEKKELASGYFMLDGGSDVDFGSDTSTMQEFTLSFQPTRFI